MEFFSEGGNWDVFIDILGLAIYGIIFFPHLSDYIDLPVIDVFLTYRERGRNLVATTLANTYYTIHSCHEKKGGRLVGLGKHQQKGTRLRTENHGASASYKNWLKIGVNMINLPFSGPLPTTSDSSIPDNSKNKEIDEFSEVLVQMKNEEENLKRKVEEAYE
ncbi:hypothetical protein CR513_32910, partial [Mucuna pruriens]